MSRKKWEALEKEYSEAILFQDVLKKLQFESIGEFVELIGGVMGMLNVNDIDNAKKISEAFALRIGYILDQIGYVDKIIDKNKTMRDFYEEQQKKLAEQAKQKELAKATEAANATVLDTVPEPEAAMTFQLDPELFKVSAKHVGAGWYELSTGKRIRGRNNLPENVLVED